MALHVMDEANRCLQCKVPQCQKGCPISTNIPVVIRLLKENKLNEAGKMLFENNPLTTVCSLVCNHEKQCEGHCVMGKKGAPVHFSTIENYISTTFANTQEDIISEYEKMSSWDDLDSSTESITEEIDYYKKSEEYLNPELTEDELQVLLQAAVYSYIESENESKGE